MQLQGLRDAVDCSLSVLEQHCQLLESMKQDTTLTVEQLLPSAHEKSLRIRAFYQMIDRLESVVRQVGQSVERMDQELCVAESTFSTSTAFKVPKLLSSLLTTRKKPSTSTRLRYEAPPLFRTSQLFASHCEEGAEAREDEAPPLLFNSAASSYQE